ncbi:DUF6506 family protein [Megasphaera sueciensis]|uniref:DUF6506 family protein n=1 Tax=Megasphaera sueciensis TaxID=349094 RepID=UPI003D00D4D1
MGLQAAFIFLGNGNDPEKQKATVHCPHMDLHVIGVDSYEAAANVASKLAEQGVGAIELCGGFGIEGTALVKKAVTGKAVIGVVRFDGHPGLKNKSGDEIF